MLKLLFLTLGIIIGSNNLLFAFDCWPNYYPMLCRGKIPVDIFAANSDLPDQAYVQVRFMSHMPVGAGAEGEKLIAGTCAFEDRPINAQEPDVIMIVAANHVVYSGVSVLERCLSQEQCVVRLCVRNSSNASGDYFLSQEPLFVLSTFYPKFVKPK